MRKRMPLEIVSMSQPALSELSMIPKSLLQENVLLRFVGFIEMIAFIEMYLLFFYFPGTDHLITIIHLPRQDYIRTPQEN